MKHVSSRWTRKVLSAISVVALAASLCLPAAALAEQSDVRLANHTLDGTQPAAGHIALSGIAIDGVDAPKTGQPLDDTAHVASDQGVDWDIPVLWVDASLHIATHAQEDGSYLPALAFFVPEGYVLEGDSFAVRLSDSLVSLFGGSEIVAVYDSSTRITYIMPAAVRGLFAPGQSSAAASAATMQSEALQAAPAVQPGATASAPSQPSASAAPVAPAEPSWIDIYCAASAVKALSEDDLDCLLDLIINRLQPQAVELLLEKFPAFAEAAGVGQIGREIGLYVYYASGDLDGLIEHDTPKEALAYVDGRTIDRGGVKYTYIIGVDVADLLLVDEDEEPIPNASGKFTLLREGAHLDTFENTIVHEMFHAFMDDYNRTGMMGGTNPSDVLTDDKGEFFTQQQAARYQTIRYPNWFIEGSASAVENVFQFRNDNFKAMKEAKPGSGIFDTYYDVATFFDNYLGGTVDGKPLYADLCYAEGYDASGNEINKTQSAYAMGYVATLYLSELKARATTGSAVDDNGEEVVVSSEKLRMGLNGILKDLHEGATLDQVINAISPLSDEGAKLYTDTQTFQDRFIKGALNADNAYVGDMESLRFAVRLLNHLQDLGQQEGRAHEVNGSVLFDFAEDYASPLDGQKNADSDFYRIALSNQLVESTVPNEVALRCGGKTDPDAAKPEQQAAEQQQAAKAQEAVAPQDEQAAAAEVAPTELPLAAKAPAQSVEVATAAEEVVEPAAEDAVEPAAASGKATVEEPAPGPAEDLAQSPSEEPA